MSQSTKIDALMERASLLLEQCQYHACEQLCLEALAEARATGDYQQVARIMMPLQEVRRQRRQAAVEAGVVVLGEPAMRAQAVLDAHPAGCLLLLDGPYGRSDEQAVRQEARRRGATVEVLRVDRALLEAMFLEAMERRGEAVLAEVQDEWPVQRKVDYLLERLEEIGDHEIACQQLAEWARQAGRTPQAEG